MEKIPLRLEGEVRGEVRVYPEGLHTVFEAVCPPAGRMVRLWLHGDGGKIYLGVMEPRGGRLHLRRAFTRMELEAFPKPIRWAGEETADFSPLQPEIAPGGADVYWRALPNPWSLFSDTYSKMLLLGYRGALSAQTEAGYLLALPLRGAPPRLRGAEYLEKRKIGGNEYAVYRIS